MALTSLAFAESLAKENWNYESDDMNDVTLALEEHDSDRSEHHGLKRSHDYDRRNSIDILGAIYGKSLDELNTNRSRATPDTASIALPKLKTEQPEQVWVAESLSRASRSRWSTFTFHYKYDCFSASVSIPSATAAQRAMRPCKYCVTNWKGRQTVSKSSDTIGDITRESKKPKLAEHETEPASPSEPLSPCSLPTIPYNFSVIRKSENSIIPTIDDEVPETPLSPVALPLYPNSYSPSYHMYPSSGYSSLTASRNEHADYNSISSDESVTEDLLASPVHVTQWNNSSYSTLMSESFSTDVGETSAHFSGFVFPTDPTHREFQPTCLTDLIQMDLF